MHFTGDFEYHLTVRCGGQAIDELARWAASRRLKFTHIVLDRGRSVSQPMLTARGSGALTDVMAAADATMSELRAGGFTVARVKIEAAPWTTGVPRSDEEAVALGAARYFEHHVKVLLPAGTDAAALAATATPHSAHLSRNTRRVRDDGRQERFVTQRCRRVGLRTAGRRLDALVTAVRAAGYEVGAVEREFVVVDSDESLDEGWIDERGPRDGR